MKKIGFIFFLFIFSVRCFPQYAVTKVIGNVKKMSGEILTTGSILADNDVLVFSSQTDLVRMFVSGKGVYIINSSFNVQNKQNNSVIEILKYTMPVKTKEGYLDGRGENITKIPEAFETNPDANKKILIRSESKFLFSVHNYDLSNGSKFFIQIVYEGSKPIIHSLKTNGDTLLIHAADFKTDNTDISKKAKYMIGFYSKEKNTSESLGDIDPYFDGSGEMEAIIKVVASQSKQTDKSKLQDECYAEVYGALGKPSDIDFKNAFEKVVLKEK